MTEPLKQIIEKHVAPGILSIPSSTYWIADIVEEKNTMNEQVAAVTCITNMGVSSCSK